jgi:hypothetical protein
MSAGAFGPALTVGYSFLSGSRTSCAGRRWISSSGTNSIRMPHPAYTVSIRERKRFRDHDGMTS